MGINKGEGGYSERFGNILFLFEFGDDANKNRVLANCPRTFDKLHFFFFFLLFFKLKCVYKNH